MTYEELREAGFVELRRCGMCDGPIGYLIHPTLAAACFDGSCDCAPPMPYRPITHEELAAIPSLESRT